MYTESEYLYYCEVEANKMYPEIYHQIFPHVHRICEREDHLYNPMMHPFPRKEVVDRMIEEIYENIQEDNMHRSPEDFTRQRDFLRSIIGIILLRELLDRRRRRRRRRRPGYYDYDYDYYY
ncbi:MAG: hypothetical protein ACOYVK_15805 [Bacillota bacterium]